MPWGGHRRKQSCLIQCVLPGTIVSAESMPWNQRTVEKQAKSKSPESSFPAPGKDIQLLPKCLLFLGPQVPWAVLLILFPSSVRRPYGWVWEEGSRGKLLWLDLSLAQHATCPASQSKARRVTHSRVVFPLCISRGPS